MTEPYRNLDARDGHPDTEKVFAYRGSELTAAEEERVQEHLVTCEKCVDLMLLSSTGPPEQEIEVVDFEKEWIWTRIQSERAQEAYAQIKRSRRKRTWERFALAAAMLAVFVLGGFNAYQGGVISDLTTPQLNTAIHDFVSEDPRRGPSAEHPEPTLIEIPKTTSYYTAVFPLGIQDGDTYRVTILDLQDEEVWSQMGLEVDALGFATLGLSRHFLAEGSYRILISSEGTEQQVIGDYSVTIRFL